MNEKLTLNDRLIVVMTALVGGGNVIILDNLFRMALRLILDGFSFYFITYIVLFNIIIFGSCCVYAFVCVRKRDFGKGLLLVIAPIFLILFQLNAIGKFTSF